MTTKLTLRIDKHLIEGAKAYARTHGKSVWQPVADYFAALGADRVHPLDQPTPPVDSLRGVLRNKGLHGSIDRKHPASNQDTENPTTDC